MSRPQCDRCTVNMHKNGTLKGRQRWRCPKCNDSFIEGETLTRGPRKRYTDGLTPQARYWRRQHDLDTE